MVVYKVFYKNFEFKKGEFVGMLLERRKDMRGETQFESAMRWAKLAFGRTVKDGRTIFVVPKELKTGINTQSIIEKGVITKEEILGMGKPQVDYVKCISCGRERPEHEMQKVFYKEYKGICKMCFKLEIEE